jgi:branched-chain amino acid transport system permease protein
MHTFVQAVILGVLTGGVYALMASGLALAFGVMRVVNVAQGALIILGAYVSHSLFTRYGVDPFIAIVVMTPAMFALGAALQYLFIKPLRRDEREELSLLVTWALALGIEGLLGYVYQTTYRATITSYANASWDVGGYIVLKVRAYAFVVSLVILGLLYLILARTRFGRSMRATIQNPVAAELLGIDPERVSAIAFGISVATATAAGAVYGIVFPFNPGSHYDLISLLLTIVVLGGLGSLAGAVVAALIVGVSEAVLSVEISPTWASLTFFLLLIATLIVRPQGLFGRVERGAL